MIKALFKFFQRRPDAGQPSNLFSNRQNNAIELCRKCQVPVVVQGALIKCLNGCLIGSVDYVPDERACEANHYNPLRMILCAGCGGDGRTYFKEGKHWCAKECEQCRGQGAFRRRQYNDVDEKSLSQALPVTVDEAGWARCPKCNFKFLVADETVFLDGRHRRCGQIIIIPA